jgi:hypothetical protein
MTAPAVARPGLLRRLIDWLKAIEDASDYGGFDYLLDRIKNLESELAKLRDDIRNFRS